MTYKEFRKHIKTLGLNNKRFGELIGVDGKIVTQYNIQGVPKMTALLVAFMIKTSEMGLELSEAEQLALTTLQQWNESRNTVPKMT
jgi:hypothetical protein